MKVLKKFPFFFFFIFQAEIILANKITGYISQKILDILTNLQMYYQSIYLLTRKFVYKNI